MNNGQCTIASMPTVIPLVSQQSAVSAAISTGGMEQDDGNFAGVLSGLQLQAKEQDGQASQLTAEISRDQLQLDAVTVDQTLALLALLQAAPCVTAAATAESPQGEQEKADVGLLRSESPGVMPQLSVAASSQPGRTPEVNVTPAQPVDMLQSVVVVTEQPAVTDAYVAVTQVKPAAAEQLVETELQPAKHAETSYSAVAATTTSASQPVQPDRMSVVNNLTTAPVNGLQNVIAQAAPEQVADASVSPDKVQAKQLVGEQVQTTMVKVPVTLSAEAVMATAAEEHIVPQGANRAGLTVMPGEKVASSSVLQDELPDVTLPAVSPESELEIQLSQPRPITAQVTANIRQQLVPEQQIEAVRAGNERSAVKESGQSLQMTVSESEPTLGAETSPGSDSSGGQPDVASDNQMLAQDMRGQLRAEQQNSPTLSAKPGPTEPARQDVPEQVMHQVKERLVQHDVKQGSQQITLTLSPDSLGELKMNLNLQGQKLSVEIVTENRTVRDAIIQHTDSLKESLARQNITMESFDVTTGGKGSGNQGQNQSAWSELAKQQQQQFWAPPRGYQVAQADLPSGNAAYQGQQGQSMLDIHY